MNRAARRAWGPREFRDRLAPMLRWVIGGLLVACASACAGRMRVEGIIDHPAELPVRAFAPIAIVSAQDPDSAEIAQRLVEHLSADGTSVVLGESAADSSRIRVDLAVRFTTSATTRWGTRPETVCGPYGCYVRQVSYPYDVVSLVGAISIRVIDPATEQLLAEKTTQAEELGGDQPGRRAVLRRRLVAEASLWFDTRQERVDTRLPRVSGDDYARAVRLARDGRWDDAAGELRTIRSSSAFASRPVESRARVLEALAMAIRFSEHARSTPVESLGEALGLVVEAQALAESTDGRHLRESLTIQLEEARVLEVQRGSLGASANDSLTVPEAYR